MIILEKHPSKPTVILRFRQQNGSNAFDAAAGKELLKICTSLRRNPPRALAWISDHPQFYCTGGDLLAQLRSPKIKSTLRDHMTIRTALQHLDELPCPKATFVDGDCYGGGIEILSCFQHIIASPRAMFGIWQRRMGLSFAWGGGHRLLRRTSESELRRMVLEQRTLSAWEARDIGLVDELCDVAPGTSAIDRWLHIQSALGEQTAEALSGWTPKTESQVFSTLYGGQEHRSVLKQLRRNQL